MSIDKVQQKFFLKAKIATLLLQFSPFIRMVGLNGSLARGEATASSDIDFLIVTKQNRIWSTRAYSYLILALFGLKRFKNKQAGRVCLNLYQTENHLKISGPASPVWLAKNYAYTMPLWQTNDLFLKFCLSNIWIKKFKQEFVFLNYEPSLAETVISVLVGSIRLAEEFLFDFFLNDWGEQFLKNYQINRIMKDERTLNSRDGEIFLSDDELRFHLRKYLSRGLPRG